MEPCKFDILIMSLTKSTPTAETTPPSTFICNINLILHCKGAQSARGERITRWLLFSISLMVTCLCYVSPYDRCNRLKIVVTVSCLATYYILIPTDWAPSFWVVSLLLTWPQLWFMTTNTLCKGQTPKTKWSKSTLEQTIILSALMFG